MAIDLQVVELRGEGVDRAINSRQQVGGGLGQQRPHQVHHLARHRQVGGKTVEVEVAVALLFATGGAHVGQAVEVAHQDAYQLLGRQRLRQQLLLEGGDIGQQTLGNRCQVAESVLLEQAVFQAMEAAEGRVLFTALEVIGAGIDRVVQLGQALGRRGQSLVSLASRQVQGLGLGQVAGGNRLFKGADGLDQSATLAAQVHAKFRQRADKGHHRGLGFGLGVRLGRRGYMQGAAWVAQQAAGDGVVARQQVGVDHLAQARRNVFALFDHQHAVKDFPLHRAIRTVDDAKTRTARRYGQGVGFAGVGVDDHGDFVVIDLALGGGQLRGVVEQAAGGDHHDHRTGDRPTQRAGW